MTKRTTCYLAGPMRGLPYWNKNAFLQAASELRCLGYEVHSPWEHDAELGMEAPKDGAADELQLATCLSWDFQRIIEDNVVFMLPGWEQSTGCHWELTVAFATSTPVFLYAPVESWKHGARFTDFPEVVTNPTGCVPADRSVETAKIPHDWINQLPAKVPADWMATKVAQAVRGQNAARDIASDQGEHRVVDEKTGGEKGQKDCQMGALDPVGLEFMGLVAGMGSKKYDRFNFLKGYAWSLSIDAMFRHIIEFLKGNDLDEESGLPHMAHAAWHAHTLTGFLKRGIGTDDRGPAAGVRDAYAVTGPAITICEPHANHGCPVCEAQR